MGLHHTFVKMSIMTWHWGTVGVPFSPNTCALGLPEFSSLRKSPPEKLVGC